MKLKWRKTQNMLTIFELNIELSNLQILDSLLRILIFISNDLFKKFDQKVGLAFFPILFYFQYCVNF